MYSDSAFTTLFKVPADRFNNKPMNGMQDKSAQEKRTEEKKNILCRHCFQIITSPEEMIEMNGAHQHTFVNPHGIAFTIGCYKTASGCGSTGPPADEFSWFKSFSWRIGICSKCLTHLGWQFLSKNDIFFGLILDRLIIP